MTSFDGQLPKDREDRELATFEIVKAETVRGRDESIDRILRYVEQKTGSTRFARRADIQPADLKEFLPDICFFIPYYTAGGVLNDVRITLMGTNVVSFYGELTDKSVRDHPSPDVAGRILTCAAAAIENREATFAEATSLSSEQDYLAVKALYVPMAEDGDMIDRLLVYVRVVGKSLLENK